MSRFRRMFGNRDFTAVDVNVPQPQPQFTGVAFNTKRYAAANPSLAQEFGGEATPEKGWAWNYWVALFGVFITFCVMIAFVVVIPLSIGGEGGSTKALFAYLTYYLANDRIFSHDYGAGWIIFAWAIAMFVAHCLNWAWDNKGAKYCCGISSADVPDDYYSRTEYWIQALTDGMLLWLVLVVLRVTNWDTGIACVALECMALYCFEDALYRAHDSARNTETLYAMARFIYRILQGQLKSESTLDAERDVLRRTAVKNEEEEFKRMLAFNMVHQERLVMNGVNKYWVNIMAEQQAAETAGYLGPAETARKLKSARIAMSFLVGLAAQGVLVTIMIFAMADSWEKLRVIQPAPAITLMCCWLLGAIKNLCFILARRKGEPVSYRITHAVNIGWELLRSILIATLLVFSLYDRSDFP